ncbi:hypothetical protein [Natrinema sp. DC36]|uniref:hypothetical protein n=1 Tax=Natrinema sp. DC36 TaxID=2878680 RepID=UPI001CEFEB83|nr:hypothetical protein [Natrinema sp. DC36]
MSLIIEGADEQIDSDEGSERRDRRSTVDHANRATQQHQRIDVTDLHAAGIDEYVRTNVETDDVSLEHRGSRTYLRLEE